MFRSLYILTVCIALSALGCGPDTSITTGEVDNSRVMTPDQEAAYMKEIQQSDSSKAGMNN